MGMEACLVAACAFAHLTFSPNASVQHFDETLLPTWVAPAGDDLLIASSYSAIYRLRDGKLTKLDIPPEVPKFVPSAMVERSGKLYVANYLGKDVLIFDYPSMRLDRRLTEGLSGPEGIFVDEAGAIDVADFDGGAILRFDAAGTLLWSHKAQSAHGVTQIGNTVYGTALYDRTIVALNAETGEQIAVTGSNGPAPGQYIWPVGIAADGNALLVSDSLLGRITRLSAGLDLMGVVPGGNGPGEDLFGFPYGISVADVGYIIADTLKPRLLFTDKDWRITRQVTFGPKAPAGRDLPILRPVDNPTHHQTTFEPAPPLATLLGLTVSGQTVEGYNSLDVVRDGQVVQEMGLSAPVSGFPYLYWTWARQSGPYVLLGSPAQTAAIVIDTKQFRIGYVRISTDAWTIRGERDLRLTDGTLVDPATVIADAKWIPFTPEIIEQVVKSPAGRTYLKDHDLVAYLAAMSKAIYVSVPEIVAIRHLHAEKFGVAGN